MHTSMAFEQVRTIARFVVFDESPPTRRNSAGPLEIGEDLMVIEVVEKVTVRRPDGPSS